VKQEEEAERTPLSFSLAASIQVFFVIPSKSKTKKENVFIFFLKEEEEP